MYDLDTTEENIIYLIRQNKNEYIYRKNYATIKEIRHDKFEV